MAVKQSAWEIAEKAVNELPPYLSDDDLTAERLFNRKPELLSSVEASRNVLDELVKAGVLRTEDRRSGKGGSKIKVYITA